uniref:Uncharacterized protein n=1 Tax=Tanacetum cinerariifolium TaxID=118510 RepID=A0A6L2KRZ3_TANCI|nr:hypothetical protein [Tanacetum cinerariifolium]
MVISKLKERIKSLSGQMKEDKIKMELEEIETVNIKLDHRASKLVVENEHLKQTYKQLYDSFKSTRIRSKEQCDDLINQVNLKSVEIFDLNASLQEKVLVITALKDALRKLKGKALADDVVTSYSIASEMLNVDVEPSNPRLLNNRSAHSDYLKHTHEEAMILREIVEQGKSKNPLNAYLDYACKYTKQIQELLIIIEQTCPSFNNSREKLVVVTPKNKEKIVRFTEPVTSSGNTKTKTASSSNLVSNKHVLSSTGVKSSNSASGSQPSGNTKKDKIQRPPRNMFPLTRITTTAEVPLRKTIALESNTPKPVVGISHETSIASSSQQNGFVERRNRTLIEAASTLLIYAKAWLFLWAEAVATACYTQNHFIGALCYPTNDSENLGKLQPKVDIGIFIGYAPTKKAFQIYNRHTRRIIEAIHVDFDELTAMASEQSSSGPALHEMTLATISSGLVPNPPSLTPSVPPSRTDWDMLFQPLFDELLTPLPSVDHPSPAVIALIAKVVAPKPAASTGSPFSTTVNQDAPLPNVAHMNNDPFFGIPIPEVPSDQSSSTYVIHTIVHPDHQIFKHNSKWTKDHPLENIIGELARPIKAMQEELNEFEHLGVWELVPRPDKVRVITLKWIYKVKLDELGEAIRIFLAFAVHMNMVVYQMNVKTAFLNGNLTEKVYVSQLDRFVDTDKPNHVYKLKKALYGLKQAPRAWYDMLSSFLISQDFSKGSVDPTLFIHREGKKLLLMSMMGKISFFLGLQISQSPRGIFINQSKYALESFKKYSFDSCDPLNTPMVENQNWMRIKKGKPLIHHTIVARPTEKHLHAVKRIFRYLRGTVNQGLWYSKDSSISLTAFTDVDHAGCQDTCCSISGSMQFLGDRLVSWSSKRSKHIDIKYHFIKKQVENEMIKLYFVNTEYQLEDIFTKALGKERIEFLINKLGMRSLRRRL